MEMLVLVMMIGLGAFWLKSRDQARRVALLGRHLMQFQIETLLDNPPRLVCAMDNVFPGINGKVLRVFVEAQHEDVSGQRIPSHPIDIFLAVKG